MPGPARRAMKQSEIVARQITQQIIADGLAEGTRLPPEKAMVEEYQVGRGTLREALRLLETRGVLSIKTGRDGGPVVRGPKPSDLGEAISLTLRFDGVTPEQLLSAQRVLTPRLVRRAAERVTPATLAAMDECLHRMETYLDHQTVFAAESSRFHDLVAAAAESSVLALLVRALESVLASMLDDAAAGSVATRRARRVRWTSLHRRLHTALANADVDGAVQATDSLVDLMAPQVRGSSRAGRGGFRPSAARAH